MDQSMRYKSPDGEIKHGWLQVKAACSMCTHENCGKNADLMHVFSGRLSTPIKRTTQAWGKNSLHQAIVNQISVHLCLLLHVKKHQKINLFFLHSYVQLQGHRYCTQKKQRRDKLCTARTMFTVDGNTKICRGQSPASL
jgi:hypothetical protein